MKRAYLFIGVVLFLLLIYSLDSQTLKATEPSIEAIPPTNPHLELFIDQFTNRVETIQEENKIPAVAIAIVRDSSVLYYYAKGVKTVGTTDSIDTHTVFRIGSLSKGFAGVLTGLEVEEGDLTWEDKVVEHVPSFQLSSSNQTQAINLRHILSHTTGLPYHTYTNLVEAEQSIETIIPRLSGIKLIGGPGERYAYQNAVFSVISEVLEHATGEEIQYLLKRKIFDPLGMQDASSSFELAKNNSNMALPHKPSGGQWRTRSLSRKYYNTIAAGGVNASIDDMAKWMLALLGNKPEAFSQKMLNSVFVPFVKTPIEHRYFSNWTRVDAAYYGMGWRVLRNNGEDVVYHSGLVNGYRSEIAINRTDKTGICILMNAPSQAAGLFVPLFLENYEMVRDSIM